MSTDQSGTALRPLPLFVGFQRPVDLGRRVVADDLGSISELRNPGLADDYIRPERVERGRWTHMQVAAADRLDVANKGRAPIRSGKNRMVALQPAQGRGAIIRSQSLPAG